MDSTIIRVTKSFTFDMAHALLGYDGPCKHIHGHTYHLHVTLKGQVLEHPSHPKDGMVMDFGRLKAIVQQHVIAKYDHSLVLNKALAEKHQLNLAAITERLIFTDWQPTCENLMLSIKADLQRELHTIGYILCAVKLYETPTSYAEWRIEDND